MQGTQYYAIQLLLPSHTAIGTVRNRLLVCRVTREIRQAPVDTVKCRCLWVRQLTRVISLVPLCCLLGASEFASSARTAAPNSQLTLQSRYQFFTTEAWFGIMNHR